MWRHHHLYTFVTHPVHARYNVPGIPFLCTYTVYLNCVLAEASHRAKISSLESQYCVATYTHVGAALFLETGSFCVPPFLPLPYTTSSSPHPQKQARWLDVSLGKFELTEWHAIAEQWFKEKPRNSDQVASSGHVQLTASTGSNL